MPNPPIDPGRREDDVEEPGRPDEAGTRGDGGTGAGRDDPSSDPGALRDQPPAGATGGGAGGEGALAAGPAVGRAAGAPPALDDDPIGGPGSDPDGHPDGRHDADDPQDDLHDEHAVRSGLAATILKFLLVALVIFGLSLWLVPKMAPHLPEGIARHLMPAQAELDRRLATLTQQIETGTAGTTGELSQLREQVAALTQRVEEAQGTAQAAQQSAAESAAAAESNAVAGESVARAEAAAAEASRMADTATTAATEAGKVAAAASRDTASLARRMAGFEARLAELSGQVQAVGDSLAQGAADGETATPELTAAFASLRAQVDALGQRVSQQADFLTAAEAERFATQDDLRSARLALGAEIAQAVQALPPAEAIVVQQELQALRQEAQDAVQFLNSRLQEVRQTAEQAAQTAGTAEQSATQAVGRAGDAIRQASLDAAAASLTSRLVNGLPFADALDQAAQLMDAPAPDPLASVAARGVPTTDELLRRFGRPARDAVEADLEARSGGGIVGRASARVRSVLGGRAAGEQPGESVEAVLSRMEARLREGDPAATLTEAEALPEPARAALGTWLDELRDRVAALRAAEEWLAPAGSGTEG